MESPRTVEKRNERNSTNMEIDGISNDEGLLSKSLEDIASCSSSILNTPDHDARDEDLSDDDNEINVTIKNSGHGACDTVSKPTAIFSVDGESKTPNLTKPIKMSGGMRKRISKLVLRGYDRTTAREIVFANRSAENSVKRPSNALDLSGSGDGKPHPKRIKDSGRTRTDCVGNAALGRKGTVSVNQRLDVARGSTSGLSKSLDGAANPAIPKELSYSDVTGRVKVGILPKDYPLVELSTEQQNLVEEAIFGAVVLQRKEQLKPKFANCTYKPGFMIVNCLDKQTSEWLIKTVPTLVPWEDAELVAVDESNIPKKDILVVVFPKSAKYDNNTIKALIESQNDNLYTDAWRILNRSVLNDIHIEWALTVDGASMKTLVDRDMFINYKFGQIMFKKSLKTSGKPRTAVSSEGRNGNFGQLGKTNCTIPEGNTKGTNGAYGRQNSGSNNMGAMSLRRGNSRPSSDSGKPANAARQSKSHEDPAIHTMRTSTLTFGNHSNQREQPAPLKNGNQNNNAE